MKELFNPFIVWIKEVESCLRTFKKTSWRDNRKCVWIVFFALISTLDCYFKGAVRHSIVSMTMFDRYKWQPTNSGFINGKPLVLDWFSTSVYILSALQELNCSVTTQSSRKVLVRRKRNPSQQQQGAAVASKVAVWYNDEVRHWLKAWCCYDCCESTEVFKWSRLWKYRNPCHWLTRNFAKCWWCHIQCLKGVYSDFLLAVIMKHLHN